MRKPPETKRYHTLTDELSTRYGKKTFKIALDGGFTCPNRDGSKGTGGCAFCSLRGSGDFAGDRTRPLADQFAERLALMKRKWPDGKFVVYFQAFTNTYAAPSRLKELYETAIQLDPDIVGLNVGTRPDCLDDDVVAVLKELAAKTDVTVELGLQTIHPATQAAMNLCYATDDFDDAVKRLHSARIPVVAHVIDGLPDETPEMMRKTIRHVAARGVAGVKIHMLHVLKGTALGARYEAEPFPLLTLSAYVSIVCDQLELLPPDVVIHRLTGDAPAA
ncbi:MAG: TIGR01212 family radical SAM protein, partial [Bacillota bacterium]|nr:TIGR01212 family radical SAM protein [Bacillota bacterium]